MLSFTPGCAHCEELLAQIGWSLRVCEEIAKTAGDVLYQKTFWVWN